MCTKRFWTGERFSGCACFSYYSHALGGGTRVCFRNSGVPMVLHIRGFSFTCSDVEKTRKIVQSLKIDIQERQLGNRDRRAALRAMMCRWLALSDCVLRLYLYNLLCNGLGGGGESCLAHGSLRLSSLNIRKQSITTTKTTAITKSHGQSHLSCLHPSALRYFFSDLSAGGSFC